MQARLRIAVWSALVAFGLGCATSSGYEFPDDFAPMDRTAAEQTTPLGGVALSQMKQQMQRAHRDLIHFHATLESLRKRRERSGLVLFNGFLDAYMGMHLDPLLRGEWQSRHPELMALDANLRFAKAEVLIQMRDPGRVQNVIDEIVRRFEGRGNMLVEFPIGSQGTLQQGIEILSARKWQG